MTSYRVALAIVIGASGCSFIPSGDSDASGSDATAVDAASRDGALVDARPVDAGPIDARPVDAGPIDARPVDAGPIDARPVDAATDAMMPIDAPTDTPGPDDIIHIAANHETIGTGDLGILTNATVTTSGDPTGLNVSLPTGVSFLIVTQDPEGPELAVLRVRNLTITSQLRVVGQRPFVILADNVVLTGVIDASGQQGTPGAGGSTTGPGAGGNGQGRSDSSGGGGGAGIAANSARPGRA
jgi:hypothetical protein